MDDQTPVRFRFLFLSSNACWGGSEELWSGTAEALAAAGHEVTAKFGWREAGEPRFRRLRELGCDVSGAWAMKPPVVNHRGLDLLRKGLNLGAELLQSRLFVSRLRHHDLAVVSQGTNFDGRHLARLCQAKAIPYVLIAQKATETYWPSDEVLPLVRSAYANARRCFFVSHHNQRVTEEQLGMRLPHAEVVRNPFQAPWRAEQAWPDTSQGFRLACVGRLQPDEKGQDLLLRVLARPKWRQRPLQISFFGDGTHKESLARLADLLGLGSVTFHGFTEDVSAIWKTHHALVLASRCEGLPLVVVEAMLHGRLPIATNVAGTGEVVEDGVTGFLAEAPTEDLLDDALERAWSRREEWQAMGGAAADAIRELVPEDPAGVLAAKLVALTGARAASPLEAPAAHERSLAADQPVSSGARW